MTTLELLNKQPIPGSILVEINETPGWLSLDEATLLYQLARQTTEGCIVEIGSYRGRSTIALSKGALAGGNRPVYAIEPHETFVGVLGGQFGPQDRGAFFSAMLKTASYKNVRLVNLSSEIITPGWQDPVSLLWIDGDHSYEGVKRDYECWKDHLASNSYIAFDDATDQRLGPYKLINEIVRSGRFVPFITTGKVVVVKSQ